MAVTGYVRVRTTSSDGGQSPRENRKLAGTRLLAKRWYTTTAETTRADGNLHRRPKRLEPTVTYTDGRNDSSRR
ncbi:hypothetical protein AArc1_3441 [Natrarchaeobaculum sulfurireducens]|uniref:Uncharacterized protein n=1 Tax=Natrarchaeobaculum sulfurireducens TaxID=2044521 RepID=A0A346PJN9_9EURY|nr:hypothetical protein AArc1_3441 [Natrarchaeobaculum sulfurireducens]